MSTTPTTNYSFLKPTDGNDDDAWGGHLNTTIDSIDTELKAVSDVADAAAADAAAALAAVGGNATITFFESIGVGNTGTTVQLDDSSAYMEFSQQSGVHTLTLTSTMAVSKALRKTFVCINLPGGSIAFVAGSGVDQIISDIGSGGDAITAQGRHIVEVYASNSSAGDCIVVLKRIGVSTA
jgi:hypothetical protein